MDKHLEAFFEEFGPPTTRVEAEKATIQRLSKVLPPALLGYWAEVGFSGFADGLFWLTNPDEYEGALEEWIGDTPIMEEDAYYVIGRSAFGALFLWGARNGYKYVVNASRGWIVQTDEDDRALILSQGADASIHLFLDVISRRRCDIKADDRSPLFEQALSSCGPLKPDEVYAFEPALVAGGAAKVGNLVKRNIHVHLSILAQFGHREILDREALTRRAFGSAV